MLDRSTFTALLLAFGLCACATNPVSGRRELNLVSEAQEAQLGAQAHRQILEDVGIYDENPALNQMVTEIGRSVALVSDLPELPWRFTLLDTPMVNAMALPGGYVYVTRGILERMNSRDELAGVIAHEISHVAARHGAQRMSQAQLAQLGLMIGSVVAGPAASQAYGGLAQIGATLLFQRYSRTQETQADLLGTAYMTEAGFNPKGAEEMLLALSRLDEGKRSGVERYFVDHPDPLKRVADVRSQIAKLSVANASIVSRERDRAAFLQSLSGMVTGRSTLETTVRDGVVYQRKYGIILAAPASWEVQTGGGGLFVMAPARKARLENTAIIVQEVPLRRFQGYPDTQRAVRSQFEQMGLRYIGSQNARASSGETFVVDGWTGSTQRGSVVVETAQMTQGDQLLLFIQMSPNMGRGQSELTRTLGRMTIDRERARRAEPARMKIGKSQAGDVWSAVASRATGARQDAEEVAEMNGFDEGTSVPSGIALKLPEEVVREEDDKPSGK